MIYEASPDLFATRTALERLLELGAVDVDVAGSLAGRVSPPIGGAMRAGLHHWPLLVSGASKRIEAIDRG